jgi:hypothetical protein
VADFRKVIFENGSSMITEIYFRSEKERLGQNRSEDERSGRKRFYDELLEREKKLDSEVVFAFCSRVLQQNMFLPLSYQIVCMREFLIYVRRHIQKTETPKSLEGFKLFLQNLWRRLLGMSVPSN